MLAARQQGGMQQTRRASLRGSKGAARGARSQRVKAVNPRASSDLLNTTFHPKEEDKVNAQKRWLLLDASGKRLGRLATVAANHLRGKTVPTYTPSADMGAYVVVINAEEVDVTGRKRHEKEYKQHPTGHMGGMKVETFEKLQGRIPERIIERAVWGMLPKTKLGREVYRHLYVYRGPDHPHQAQQPEDISHQVGFPRPSPKGPGGKYA